MQRSLDDTRSFRLGRRLALVLCATAIVVTGCESTPELEVPEGCNPLAADWDCLLPYPSDFFLADDASMPSGRRVTIAEPALPHDGRTHAVDMTRLHPADGFSPLPAILVYFPDQVDVANLVFHTGDVEGSLGDASPTVLLDAETGERVVHFAELDTRVDEGEPQAMIIRPLVRLEDNRRYIVALRRIAQVGGASIPAPEGFALLRDREAGGHALLGPLSDRYEDEVFPALETAGVDRSELQLAWDFTTATAEGMTGDMLRLRDLAMEVHEASDPTVTVSEVDDDVDDQIARRLRGTIEVPLFLESTELGARLHRNAEGRVEQNGTATVEFLAIVPHSLAEDQEGSRPGRLLQFGHGFFGSRNDADSEFMHSLANRTRSVIVAIDWWGLSDADVDLVGEDISNEMEITLRLVDRVHQAMANQIAVTYAVRSSMTELSELTFDDELAYDPAQVYYYGISMGHILGGTYLTLTPHVDRAALNVGGCGFTHIMFRSRSFGPLFMLINFAMDSPLEQQKFSALSHLSFDRIDPATYAPLMFDSPLPGSPTERRLLMHVGIGDAKVPNLASHLHARMLGVAHLQPAPRPIYGLEAVSSPFDGSALVEFDLGIQEPLPGTYAEMSEDNGVHDDVRRLDDSIEQVDRFLRPGGMVECTCDGICDPD